MVAVLYIDPLGPYPKIPGLECWDATRDARRYVGPGPVIAHPPCGPWGRLRHFYRGAEHDCAPIAVGHVRRFGGVLEHPAGSLLWAFCGLPRPSDPPDGWGGYTVEVNQVDWGHVARKATWLYLVRVPRSALVTPAPREPTHWVRDQPGRIRPSHIKACSKEQRRRTPIHFALYLISLARAAA